MNKNILLTATPLILASLLMSGCINSTGLSEKNSSSSSLSKVLTKPSDSNRELETAKQNNQQYLQNLLVFSVDTGRKRENGQDKFGNENVIYQGVMDIYGKVIIPARYKSIMMNQYPQQDYEIIGVEKDWDKNEEFKADYYDIHGKLLAEDMFFPFFSGMPMRPYFVTYQESLNTEEMEKVVKERMEGIEDRLTQRDIFKSEIEPLFSDLYETSTGRRVPLAGTGIMNLSRDISPNQVNIGLLPAIDSKTGKLGFIDKDANWVIPANYRASGIQQPLPESLLTVIESDEKYDCHQFLRADNHQPVGEFYNFEKFVKLPFNTSSVQHVQKSQYVSLAKACGEDAYDSNYGVINENGDWLIEPEKNKQLLSLPDEKGFVTFQDVNSKAIGSLQLQGSTSKVVIPAKFYAPKADKMSWKSYIEPTVFVQGLMAVSETKDSDDYGFINRQGDWVIQPTQQPRLKTNNYNSYGFDKNGLAYSFLDAPTRQLRVINKQGKDVFPQLSGTVSEFNDEGFAPYKTPDGFLGVINLKGEIVNQTEYQDSLHYLFKNNEVRHKVKQDISENKEVKKQQDSSETKIKSIYGVMDARGNMVIEPKYADVAITDNYAIVKDFDDNYSVIDYQGKVMLEPQEKDIYQLIEGNGVTFKAIYNPQSTFSE